MTLRFGGFGPRVLLDEGGQGGQGGTQLKPGDEGYDRELERARRDAGAERVRANELEARLAAIEADNRKRDEEAAAAQGRYKELYEAEVAKSAAAQATIATLTAERDQLQARVADVDTARRKELVERLPESIRKEYSGDDVTMAELERAVKAFPVGTPAPTRTHSTGSGGAIGDEVPLEKRPLNDLNEEELASLRKSHPERYRELLSGEINGVKKKNLFDL